MLEAVGCILFCSYIKPQLNSLSMIYRHVVSYSVPISNHNCRLVDSHGYAVVSYSVPISNHNQFQELKARHDGCILFCSYIKPQLNSTIMIYRHSCILFCSYIKPQPMLTNLLLISYLCRIPSIGSGDICHLIRCKNTKKVPIATGFDVFSASFPFRSSSRCLHIACL